MPFACNQDDIARFRFLNGEADCLFAVGFDEGFIEAVKVGENLLDDHIG